MKNEGYIVEPNIHQLGKYRKLMLEQVIENTGLSRSSIAQLELGGRNLMLIYIGEQLTWRRSLH